MIKFRGTHLLFSVGIFSLIILLTYLVYSNSFQGSFQYDDIHAIVKNPYIRDLSNIPQIFLYPHMGSGIFQETNSYRPLLMATFALNYFFGGLNVFGYHLFNLIIHIFSAILVYLITLFILRIVFEGKESPPLRNHRFVSLFAALIFAVHPVQTESVTLLTGRSSLMTGLFFLASFLTYMHYRLTGKLYQLFLSSIIYGCALLVKEIAITLPVILVLFNWFFPLQQHWKHRFFSISPHLVLSTLYLVIRGHFFGFLQNSAQPLRPFYDNLLTQLRAWVHYLGTLLFPLNLNVLYDFPISHSALDKQVLLSFFILVMVAVLIWKISKSLRPAGFFALWFAVTLLPTNSLISLDDVVADRWLYLPSVGFAVLTALGVEWIFRTKVRNTVLARKIIFLFFCVLTIELYSVATLLRNFTLVNDWMLWEDVVSKSPNMARPRNGLGLALLDVGRMDEAIREFKKAIEIDPTYSSPYLNLGKIYYLQGKFPEAIQVNQTALSLNSSLAPNCYNNLGLIYFEQGRMEEAILEYQKAIKARPFEASPTITLESFMRKKGRLNCRLLPWKRRSGLILNFLMLIGY